MKRKFPDRVKEKQRSREKGETGGFANTLPWNEFKIVAIGKRKIKAKKEGTS